MPQRPSTLKKLYRWPLDTLEELTTGMAHVVLVNRSRSSHYSPACWHYPDWSRLLAVHSLVCWPAAACLRMAPSVS